MKYYLALDGGGTKTAFALSDCCRTILSTCQTEGISYRQYPLENIAHTICTGTDTCLRLANVPKEALDGVCIGYPCYGESKQWDLRLKETVSRLFPAKVHLVNDVVIAANGALRGEAGIHIVCGTGSIGWGQNKNGETARCGGWLDFFSDEGSGYWLGRKALELFTHEADGRAKKSALYHIIHSAFSLQDEMDFIDRMVKEVIPYRHKVASMQLFLLQAAHAGDPGAISLYCQAAEYLCAIVAALKKRLKLADGCTVTYSGSLFRAEKLLLEPFAQSVAAIGCRVCPPKGTPLDGALMLAMTQSTSVAVSKETEEL